MITGSHASSLCEQPASLKRQAGLSLFALMILRVPRETGEQL